MSKERLEEIKNNKTYLGGTNGLIIAINTDDYDWLIEQVERAQELERLLKLYDYWYTVAFEQNKRYREALEFYAEDDNYGYEVSYRPQPEIDCMVLDDRGYTARKALEGEE